MGVYFALSYFSELHKLRPSLAGVLQQCIDDASCKIGTASYNMIHIKIVEINPYPLHFGNIQERHLWGKIQNLLFNP